MEPTEQTAALGALMRWCVERGHLEGQLGEHGIPPIADSKHVHLSFEPSDCDGILVKSWTEEGRVHVVARWAVEPSEKT